MKKEEREQLLREKLITMQAYERELRADGKNFIAGVDEVGRGPLAGPVVTACVVLPEDFDVLGVDDSKKLSEKKRNELCALIKEKAVAWGIGIVDNNVIDEINILEATKKAMLIAIEECESKLTGFDSDVYAPGGIDHVLIDAVKLDSLDKPQTSIVKGDATSLSIAAASIVAKVTRDNMMIEWDEEYPWYGFASNKGYGTRAHYEGLRTHGMCPLHRKSFLKNL